jgi:predicted enzyme related to lactoylglutathione lyase
MSTPLFTNVDCLGIHVPDLGEALAFYRDKLGHELLWRNETSAGLAFAEGGEMPELVLHTDPWPIAAAIKVESVPSALERFVSSGGSVVEPASDIAIGRLAVVSDPWNNHLVLLDASKGQLQTDLERNVTGVAPVA